MKQTRRALLASVATGAAAGAGCAAPRGTTSEGGTSPYTRVYSEVLPSVVVVHVAENGRKVGQGSGFAIDPRTVITNHHVVDPGAAQPAAAAAPVATDANSARRVCSIHREVSPPAKTVRSPVAGRRPHLFVASV